MEKRLENYLTLENKRYRLLAEKSKIEKLQRDYSPALLGSSVGGVHSGDTSAPTENAAIKKLAFYEETGNKIAEINAELAEVEAELKFLDDFIEACPDEMIKETMKLRYKQRVSWANIAIRWCYAPSSWFHIKDTVINYIRENQHDLL